jgi:hypothetical protein
MRISVNYRDGSKTLNDRHNSSNIVNNPCTAIICHCTVHQREVQAFNVRLRIASNVCITHRGDTAVASDNWKSDVEKRSGDDRRAARDRRSGRDIRSEKEKRTISDIGRPIVTTRTRVPISALVYDEQLSSIIHSNETPSFLPSIQITRQCRVLASPSMANRKTCGKPNVVPTLRPAPRGVRSLTVHGMSFPAGPNFMKPRL